MVQDVEVWKQVFQESIREVKPWHTWTLTPDKSLRPNVFMPGWMQYQQFTFARFWCSSCFRSWASAQVLVLFHMHWNEEKSRGQVKMRVFAQKCRKCSQPQFEVPQFTQENISRILKNLVFRILKKCYREGFQLMEETPTIQDVFLEGPHDSDNCEACLQGFCTRSPQTTSLSTWTPRAKSIHEVEKGAKSRPLSEDVYSCVNQNHMHKSLIICYCCLILIVMVVVIVIKTTK
ncbi:receptor-transporting protein 3 [Carlito syrichta]|uniref:Receptor-transporting protein 3 n=1 Tax=Carlito syrichta TaxID=1868482 RepID=A0A1U7UAY5_CARSF|nr:receptor-transporting protein 3 [Carlito syrichta]